MDATYCLLFTARVRSMREGNIYTWEWLSVHIAGGGTPSQVWLGGPHPRSGLGGTPSQVGGVPPLTRSGWGIPPDLEWGTPRPKLGYPPGPGTGYPPPPPGPGTGYPPRPETGYPPPDLGYPPPSTSSTWYMAGGMPLAFTQGGLSCFKFCFLPIIETKLCTTVYCYIFITRIRRLREDNVFTNVCLLKGAFQHYPQCHGAGGGHLLSRSCPGWYSYYIMLCRTRNTHFPDVGIGEMRGRYASSVHARGLSCCWK